jgi:hypothetical protein
MWRPAERAEWIRFRPPASQLEVDSLIKYNFNDIRYEFGEDYDQLPYIIGVCFSRLSSIRMHNVMVVPNVLQAIMCHGKTLKHLTLGASGMYSPHLCKKWSQFFENLSVLESLEIHVFVTMFPGSCIISDSLGSTTDAMKSGIMQSLTSLEIVHHLGNKGNVKLQFTSHYNNLRKLTLRNLRLSPQDVSQHVLARKPPLKEVVFSKCMHRETRCHYPTAEDLVDCKIETLQIDN